MGLLASSPLLKLVRFSQTKRVYHIWFYFSNSELTPDNNPVDYLFKYLISKENDTVRVKVINILGRNVKFAKACGGVLDSTFEELCDRVSKLHYINVRITTFIAHIKIYK